MIVLCSYEARLGIMDQNCRDTQSKYEQLLVKFGETPGTDSEEVFGFMKTFIDKSKDIHAKLNAPKKEKVESVWSDLIGHGM